MLKVLKAKSALLCTTILIFVFVLVTVVLKSSPAQAVSLDECEKNPSADVSGCIDLFSQKITDLGNQKKTLSSQIAQFDTQIKLAQLKIAEAQATIEKLEKEISSLGFRIGYVTGSIDQLEKLVRVRIVATYQQSYVSNLELVLTSNNFSDLILRLQYLRQVQENDKKILTSLQQTRSNYENQKDERETKQAAIETNRKKLEGLRANLDQQKLDKQVLLSTTKNDETRYQRLLEQAQAELAIAFGGGVENFMRDVKRGDTIGTVISGASGCSTGTHLHFEVHNNGSIQDTNNYLSPKSVTYQPSESETGSINPHGDYPWPLSDPITVTQGYGQTPYAQSGAYNGNPHFGIDMYSQSLSVKAVKDGKLYGGSYQGCRLGPLIYARVKHDDQVETLYLHTIPK